MVGQFKDDRLQDHNHNYIAVTDSWSGTQGAATRSVWNTVIGPTYGVNAGARYGNTTRGKRKGVKFIVKVL